MKAIYRTSIEDIDKRITRRTLRGSFGVQDRVSDRTKTRTDFVLNPNAELLQRTYLILLDELEAHRKLYFVNMKYFRGMGEFVKWVHITPRGRHTGFVDQWEANLDRDMRTIDAIQQSIRNLKYYAKIYNIVLTD